MAQIAPFLLQLAFVGVVTTLLNTVLTFALAARLNLMSLSGLVTLVMFKSYSYLIRDDGNPWASLVSPAICAMLFWPPWIYLVRRARTPSYLHEHFRSGWAVAGGGLVFGGLFFAAAALDLLPFMGAYRTAAGVLCIYYSTIFAVNLLSVSYR